MEREIAIVNRGKVAYLYMHNIFEDRLEKIVRSGKEQYAFIYKMNDEITELLEEFDFDDELKKYNNCFKSVSMAIVKAKSKEL